MEYLKSGAFIVQIWGKQKDEKPKAGAKTKAALPGGPGLHAINTNQKVSVVGRIVSE